MSQNGPDEGGKESGSATPHTNDLAAVQNGLLAELNTGQFSGAALGHVQAILSDITTAISAANASASSGAFGNARRRTSTPRQPAQHHQYRQYRSRAGESGGADGGNRTSRGARRPTPPTRREVTAPDANSAETTHLAETDDAANTAQITRTSMLR